MREGIAEKRKEISRLKKLKLERKKNTFETLNFVENSKFIKKKLSKSEASCDILKENSLNSKLISGIDYRKKLRAKLHDKIRKISTAQVDEQALK